MPQVRAKVICKCTDEAEEMEGAEQLFENKSAMTQSRIYTCPHCQHAVVVILDFRGH